MLFRFALGADKTVLLTSTVVAFVFVAAFSLVDLAGDWRGHFRLVSWNRLILKAD